MFEALDRHPEVFRLSDFTREMDLDFEFRFEGEDVRLELKEKVRPYSHEYEELWIDVPPEDLFILDETSFRGLLWAAGMGYLLVRDTPGRRWLYLGPWELALGPRRRFERIGNRGAGEFLKGKVLLDLRTAALTTVDLEIGGLLQVVRRSRAALRQYHAVRLRSSDDLPVIPRRPRPLPTEDWSPLAPAAAATIPSTESLLDVAPVDRSWAGLGAEMVTAIGDRWGWSAPTPIQRKAFPPVLRGENVLVLAPTAGGKTEAALLPLLDVWHRERWAPTSILAISPLKALLDDQLTRYRRATALVGAKAFAWHGDVDHGDKRAFVDQPADILLTTPESLELVLSSPRYDQRRLFSQVQAVIVDEVHAFAGTPRGAQLASLVERLDRFATADVQRIGLSATIGNPAEILEWLRGGSHRPHTLVAESGPMQGEVLSVVTYTDTPEAVAAITAASKGARTLVFARSRRRAEELAHALGAPVHHSSLSGQQRAATANALSAGDVPLAVATASLELGIDIGDLDLIIHDGAPSGPASYLQRLGRAGRRTGIRHMVFTTKEPDDLLLILAVLARVRRGDLEALPPGRGARLVLGQQALALAFERTAVPRRELHDALRWSPAFSSCLDAVHPTIDHLLAGRWLVAVGDQLVVGPTAHDRFGGARRFAELLASFPSTDGAVVVDEEGRHIGTVDWSHVADGTRGGGADGFMLAGRPWSVVGVDRTKGVVTVRTAGAGRARSWRGQTMDVDRATWEAVQEVLLATDVPLDMDERATHWLHGLRREWGKRLAEPVRSVGSCTVLDGFGGVGVHQAVLAALDLDGAAGGPSCEVYAPRDQVGRRASSCLADLDRVLDGEARRQAPRVRFRHRELVPPDVIEAEARAYYVDDEGIRRVLSLAAGEGRWHS